MMNAAVCLWVVEHRLTTLSKLIMLRVMYAFITLHKNGSPVGVAFGMIVYTVTHLVLLHTAKGDASEKKNPENQNL